MQVSAELEELQVHGQIRIRGNYLDPGFGLQSPNGADFSFGFNEDQSASDFYNALAEVNFTADMSDDVTGYIALRSYDIYGGFSDQDQDDSSDGEFGSVSGDDAFSELKAITFAGELFTGDLAGEGNDTVGLYQAYIQMDNVGGYPISVRLGRQEIVLGREFLVGNNDAGINFSGRAFDAFRVDYDNDESFRVAAFTAKLFEFRATEQDADVDLHAVYATYYGLEMLDIDAYLIWFDNGMGNGVLGPIPGPVANFGADSENLYTWGGRVYGAALEDRLTYNVEAAFQTGDVNSTNQFSGVGLGPIGTSLDVDAFALNALVQYAFDGVSYNPEVHAEYAFFSGDDDTTDGDFEQFTRLFSDVHYGKMNLGGNFDENMTNVHIIRVGGSAEANETLTLNADVLWFTAVEDQAPVLGGTAGSNVLGNTLNSSDDDLGVELDLWATLQYSEDLTLSAGWSHFFVDNAIESAFSFPTNNGMADDDLDYLWWEAQLVF